MMKNIEKLRSNDINEMVRVLQKLWSHPAFYDMDLEKWFEEEDEDAFHFHGEEALYNSEYVNGGEEWHPCVILENNPYEGTGISRIVDLTDYVLYATVNEALRCTNKGAVNLPGLNVKA